MAQFNIAEAKARLPQLIEKAALGEDIIVINRNKPLARIVALRPARRRPGPGKGQILFLAPDFDGPTADFAEYS